MNILINTENSSCKDADCGMARLHYDHEDNLASPSEESALLQHNKPLK
ncbi:hypothetical protein JIN87_12530 [Pelagicoccus mobilis]|uniref:Uncharacterized protein n=1 Tax=Pelagicoccus mobilis TaxID=415221 RepID=A0A934RZF1_9BACT|nr:hypothetical protein [Pelagicoccus mobilis]